MSNEKNYPLHPNQSHPPIMTCEIPLEEYESIKRDNAELKAENERLNRELGHVKNGDCIYTCDVVEKHVKEELKAKRALWIARAERALEKIAWFKLWNASISTMNPEDGARHEFDKWKKNLGKFLAKAEQYK